MRASYRDVADSGNEKRFLLCGNQSYKPGNVREIESRTRPGSELHMADADGVFELENHAPFGPEFVHPVIILPGGM